MEQLQLSAASSISQIFEFSDQDFKDVGRLRKQKKLPSLTKDQIDHIMSDPSLHVYIYREGPSIVAMASMYENYTLLGRKATIDSVLVGKEVVGLEPAKLLLEALTTKAQKIKCDTIEFTTESKAAAELLPLLGYADGTFRRYMKAFL